MSYKDTLEKLKGLRSSIEKEVPQLLVEQDIYEKTIRQGAEDMNKLLGTLDVDNWHFFTVNPTWGFEVYYINDDVMRSGQYKHRSWSVYFPEDLNTNVLDKIQEAMMVIIRGSDIDYYPFVEEITKVYNTLGADENMPIESRLISKAVENALLVPSAFITISTPSPVSLSRCSRSL